MTSAQSFRNHPAAPLLPRDGKADNNASAPPDSTPSPHYWRASPQNSTIVPTPTPCASTTRCGWRPRSTQ